MDTEKLVVIDDAGNEIEMDILFTFEGEGEKSYVLYVNPLEEEGSVYASIYTQEGELFPVEDEKEWEMIEEVFATFMSDEDQHDHEA